ncbi:hypothetical protein ABK040_001621 [Willaertia magna]
MKAVTNSSLAFCCLFITFIILFQYQYSTAYAKVIVVSNSTNLWETINVLQPGDELILQEGVYSTFNANSYYQSLKLYGTVNQPIIIQAEKDKKVVIDGDKGGSQNILNLDVKYFVLRGIEFRYGSRGLRFLGGQHVLLENLHIHDTGDVGISMNEEKMTYDNITIRHVQIHSTRGTGECFYLGCNNDGCRIINSIIEYNWCHHTCCDQGDGIEVKRGSYNNIIRHNVIHDVHYPGIIVYGADNGIPNVIDGNIIWNSHEHGIQITANAIVKNNIILNSRQSGISISQNQGGSANVTLLHNTVVGATVGACLTTSHTQTIPASSGNSFVYANNAFYCEEGRAIFEWLPLPQTVYSNNVITGKTTTSKGIVLGKSNAIDFVDVTSMPFDVYPSSSSPLIGAGNVNYTLDVDFNGKPRDANRIDAGALQYSTVANPGFKPKAGFKDEFTSVAQTVTPPYTRPVPPDDYPYSRNTYIISPKNGTILFQLMNTLQPGDTLLIREGTYKVQTPQGYWYIKIDAFGSPSNPITVAAYPGERVIFEGDYSASQNILNLEVMYFVLRGIEMRYGSRGLRVHSAQHSIFEDLYIHHTWDTGVNFNDNGVDYNNITLRHIRVAYTHGTGECFYLGCHGANCIFRNSLIEYNMCEHTCCVQGDGIEIKSGSYGNIIRHNVIHDTLYPGITTYDTFGKAPNIIEGNIIWNTGENGIQTTEGAIIRNNIVINAAISGISLQSGFSDPSRVRIEHNTVINSGFACMRLNDLHLSKDVSVVNNALYCEDSYGYYEGYLADTKTKSFYSASNIYRGNTNGKNFAMKLGKGLKEDFIVGSNGLDYYLTSTSALRGAGSENNTTPVDFNGNVRSQSSIDVGAYQYSTPTNPGWVVKPWFKDGFTSLAVTGTWTKPTQPIPPDDIAYAGTEYHIYKENNNKGCEEREKLWRIMANLKPGDSLIIHNGTYTTNVCGHGSWYRYIKAVGTPSHPITIKGADGEKVIIEGDLEQSQNIMDISFYYVVFKGLELRYGSRGLRLYECQHSIFENLEIHHTGENAFSANALGADYVNITIRGVHIHHTAGNAGECFYLGCNYGDCIMRDSLIEYNYCHHTCCGQGDGIELKQGSYNNIIRHNVVHDVNYPGIMLYSAPEGLPPNIVEGNIVWNVDENGIQVTGNAIIRNNIVMNVRLNGIAIQANQGKIRDVAVLHNTVIGAKSACLSTHNTNAGHDIAIAGNALYCEGGVAIYQNNPHPQTKYGVNVVRGTSSAPLSKLGNGLQQDFENVTAIPYNLYPKKNGALYNAFFNSTNVFSFVNVDFNGRLRLANRMDAGAYQYIEGMDYNPGWIPKAGPKPVITPLTTPNVTRSNSASVLDNGKALLLNCVLIFIAVMTVL